MEIQTQHGNLIGNTLTMAYRNLLKTLHNPDRFMDVIIQPVMFMLLFGYLFGGAIAGGVQAYLPTIVPGILIQTLLSAASGSGAQIREDLDSGVFDRFKSLPMAHIAPLAGQLFADILRLLVATVVSTDWLRNGLATNCRFWVDHCHCRFGHLHWLGHLMGLCALWPASQKLINGSKRLNDGYDAPILSF